MPEDYQTDSENAAEILAQWHNYPDKDEAWTSPPLALLTKNGKWQINRLWDTNPDSSGIKIKERVDIKEPYGDYNNDKGKWTNWVFHIKWGWLAEHNPKLEVYKNGVLVFERNGLANTTNDFYAPYFKMGIYKWDWNDPNNTPSIIDKRVVYYNSIKIGDESCRLVDLAP